MDILIYAAIAVVILARLWVVLGRRNDEDSQRPNPFATPAPRTHDDEDVMVLPDRGKPAESSVMSRAIAPMSLAGGLEQVKKLAADFDEKQFLQDIRNIFASIVGDFAKGDLAGSEKYLAPAVRAHFQQTIEKRRAAGEQMEDRIERIKDIEVKSARTEDTRAVLTVRIVSEQIIVTRDARNQIVSGVADKAEEITDVWTFVRETKTPGAVWQLTETRS